MKFNIQSLKRTVSGKDVAELDKAMRFARANKRYNTILVEVLKSCVKLLKSKDIDNISYEFEGEKHDTSPDELLAEIESMAKQGYSKNKE